MQARKVGYAKHECFGLMTAGWLIEQACPSACMSTYAATARAHGDNTSNNVAGCVFMAHAEQMNAKLETVRESCDAVLL